DDGAGPCQPAEDFLVHQVVSFLVLPLVDAAAPSPTDWAKPSSASSRTESLRWYVTDLPDFSACTRSASRSTAKCADIVGLETSNWSLSSPAVMGRWRSSCNTRRRVGSDRALKI